MQKKIKTYAESVGEKTFNWLSWLEHVRVNVGSDQMMEINGKAGRWPTCACGNLCMAIPRYGYDAWYIDALKGQPKDEELRALGFNFTRNISEMQDAARYNLHAEFEESRKEAIETFLAIEKRSAAILAEMGIVE